jgi:hypothetical protein
MAKPKPDLLSFLDQLIASKFRSAELLLSEAGVTAKGPAFKMERKIENHGIDAKLFRFDQEKLSLFPYFAPTSGLAKICDYILFAQEGDYLYVLLFELKWGTESAKQQLEAAEVFASFLLQSAKRAGFVKLVDDKVIVRKIRVSEERAKRRNRPTMPWKLEIDENGIINHDHSTTIRVRELIELMV